MSSLFVILVALHLSAFSVNAYQEQPKLSGLQLMADDETQRGLGYYRVPMQPGESRVFNFYVHNTSNEALSFYIYPTDVQNGRKGGADGQAPASVNNAAGSWFSEKGKSATLKPHEITKFRFTLTVPFDIKDGQYIGAIAIMPEIQMDNSLQSEKEASLEAINGEPSMVQTVINVNKYNSSIELQLPNFLSEIKANIPLFTIVILVILCLLFLCLALLIKKRTRRSDDQVKVMIR